MGSNNNWSPKTIGICKFCIDDKDDGDDEEEDDIEEEESMDIKGFL